MAIVHGFLGAIILASGKVLIRVAKALENRRQARALSDWDARSLKDIGLSRGDLDGAFSLPLHRDPTVFLASVAVGRNPDLRRAAALQGTSRPEAARTERLGNLPSAEPAPAC